LLDGKGDLQPEDLTDSLRIPRLAYLNIFITKIYIKFWCLAPVASKAAWNDLKILQQLQLFPDHDISEATSRKLAGQLWYLSEDLILFTVFASDVDVTTKRAILKASMETEGGESLKRAEIQLSSVQQKILADFVSKRSRTVFMTLGVPDKFLVVDPECGLPEMTRRQQRQSSTLCQSPMTTLNEVSPGFRMQYSQDASGVKHSYSMCCKSTRKA